MALLAFALLALGSPLHAEDAASTLVEKPLAQLTDRAITPLGERALAIRPTDWKHGETANFAFHYFSDATAKPMALEAEFYYRAISKELERDTTHWERKCHVFVFEDDADWARFKVAGGLEPWSGGIHAQGELFLQRNPHQKLKGNALAHELTHLIVYRFYGPGVPLWLNEGLAEYTATRWYSSFWRARGFSAFPRSMSVDPTNYLPLSKLTEAVSYPQRDLEVIAFYAESERLVRFLSATDKHKFSLFLETMSKGARFDSALDKNFGTTFFNLEALEKQFQPYAEKDHVETP